VARLALRTIWYVATRMITVGHFMNQRYFAFDQPVLIKPPTTHTRTPSRAHARR
jgi:hypothetical protein